MISRAHRFHGHNSLRTVYSHGKTLRSPLISIKYLPNPRRDSYRLAVVVSKRVNKSAVLRNRIRRRLYETVRTKEGHFSGPYDIVLTVFNERVAEVSSEQLDKLVFGQLQEAGILK